MRRTIMVVVVICVSLVGCQRTNSGNTNTPSIVGTWFVKIPEAPFPYHMLTFHADGTVLQANPDAGDANTSDSNGMGVWVADGDRIKGKFVEITADRTTRRFVSRGEISFVVTVDGNALKGTAKAIFYDTEGRQVRQPIAATMTGERVVP